MTQDGNEPKDGAPEESPEEQPEQEAAPEVADSPMP